MGLNEWTILDTPDSIPGIVKEIFNPNNQGIGINKIAISHDGQVFWATVRRGDRNGITSGGAQVTLYMSLDGGISWSDIPYCNLVRAQSTLTNGTFIWDIAIAPDNHNLIVVACADIKISPLAQEV